MCELSGIPNNIIGSKISRIKQGHGSFLNIFVDLFGEMEAYEIWIYMCDWTIRNSKTVIASSNDEAADISNEISALVGRNIVGFDHLVSGEIDIAISEGYSIALEKNNFYGSSVDMFYIFKGEELVFTCKANGKGGAHFSRT